MLKEDDLESANCTPARPTGKRPSATPIRLRHLDSLRAVAALLVLWQHSDQFAYPLVSGDPWLLGFLHAVPHFTDLGRMGVVIFFAVSGFVICRSFGSSSQTAARHFLVRRFCRLYPAYWVSMLGGIWLWWLWGKSLDWQTVAANLTMVPTFLNREGLLGVYWTLEVELIVYVVCLGLYLLNRLDHRALLSGMVIAFAGLSRFLRIHDRTLGPVALLTPGRHVFLLGLAVMFWGVLFRSVYDETSGFRTPSILRQRAVWLLIVTGLALPIVLDPKAGWYLLGMQPLQPAAYMSVTFGLVVFALWTAVLRVENSVLSWLGVISYSIYLFHIVVLFTITSLLKSGAVMRAWNLPFWSCLLLETSLTITIAAFVYRWVERPAISQGKRWTTSRPPSQRDRLRPHRQLAPFRR